MMKRSSSITTVKGLRENNKNRIFRYIYENPTGVTRQEISIHLSMSLPTIVHNVNQLMEEGVLEISGTSESTGGRKATTISVLPDVKISIGISISKHHLSFAAINIYGTEKAFLKCKTIFSDTDIFYATLSSQLEQFIKDNNIAPENLLGVAITLPGIVNQHKNIVEFAPTLQINKISLEKFTTAIPYPVKILNDANAGGFAEWFGTKSNTNIAYISIEKGVGGAILSNGQIYMGNHGRSAEFGHMCIAFDGKECSCGKHGCFEAYCSTDRLSYDLGITLDEFFSSLNEKKHPYNSVWNSYLNSLAIGINNIYMFLDCDIVIGGTLAQYLTPHLNTLKRNLQNLDSHWKTSNKSALRLSRYGAKSTSIGAALHFVSRYVGDT